MDDDRAVLVLAGALGPLLGARLVGCYAVAESGSFLVVTAERLDGPTETAVRELHRSLPDAGLLPGSYAPAADLRSPMTVGRGWLRAERGRAELVVSATGNTVHDRWLLHHRARAVVGPPPASVVHDVDAHALRAEALGVARARAEQVEQHPELIADPVWGRELVGALSQVLHTAHRASVLSPGAAAAWAVEQVPVEHRDLLTGAAPASGPRLRALAWDVHGLVGAEVMRRA